METPSSRLAKATVDRLVREKILTEIEAKKVLPKLADGTMRAEDWHLALENTQLKKRDGT